MTFSFRTTSIGIVAAAAAFIPFVVSAHATPTAYEPSSSVTVSTVPKEVAIRFSERLENGASVIRVTGPSGAEVTAARAVVDVTDPHRLVVPLYDDGVGTYVAAWSVVSSDDGHFTRGAYAFAVGEGIVVSPDSGSATEVVQLAAKPEALAMTIELLGNGIILATLFLFAVVFRPRIHRSMYAAQRLTVVRGYRFFVYTGALLAVAGALAQLFIKSFELAPLQQVGVLDALLVYVQTTAGSASGIRAAIVVAVVIVFTVGRKAIAERERATGYEWLLAVLMGIFAYFRASVSHATANPFYPEFSVAVNVVHLVEKDLWAGIAVILLALSVSSQLRELLAEALSRIFTLLAINVGLLALTGCYIIWLHLKSFENLLSTSWGTACIALVCAASIALVLRIYHSAAYAYRPGTLSTFLPLTFALECAAAIVVVYFSSVVIITSPPLAVPHTTTFRATDNGLTVQLSRDALRDDEMLLTFTGGTVAQAPTVTVVGERTVAVSMQKRFEGGYGFPTAVLAGNGTRDVHIRAPQVGGYDADVSFSVKDRDITPAADAERRRSFDAFGATLALVAAAGVALALVLAWWSRSSPQVNGPWRFARPLAVPVLLVAVACVGGAASALAASPLANPLKALCERDGNMWHLMQPMRAGVPLSATSREGCMWGMGAYPYLFVDAREYAYYRALPEATVKLHLAPAVPLAGVPAELTVSLTNTDGEPAELFVDMEKLVHVVIISEDQTVFAHIHADDMRPLTPQEIETSTFRLRYTFPKAGRYSIAVDYAHGMTLGSKQFIVDVAGVPKQSTTIATYESSGLFGGYEVSADVGLPIAGDVSTVRFEISKDGKPTTTLSPYLSAPMHISAIKNTLDAFIHTHGEVHPPGVPSPPVVVRDGRIVHRMAAMYVPTQFGPFIDAHMIFPSAGRYTVWAQFKVDGEVIPSRFTVDVR